MENKTNTELRTFAENISFLRAKCGYSKKSMASILGIGVKTLNKIENGIIPERLTASVVYNTARYFSLSISSLFAKMQNENV